MRAIERMGNRLKEAREALGYTQKRISEAVGSKLRSWQDYEAGKKVPGSQVVAGLVNLGVNANWVLTGEGPMRLEELGCLTVPEDRSSSRSVAGLSEPLLRLVIEAVEEALDILELDIEPPSKKVDLILAIYEMYDDTGVQPDASKVIKLVKTAA